MVNIVDLISSSTRKNQPKYTSSLYKEWLRYLKNNKLFDEYMIYMDKVYGDRGTYPNADNYSELDILAKKLGSSSIAVGYTSIRINWPQEFKRFVRENARWWEILVKIKFS